MGLAAEFTVRGHPARAANLYSGRRCLAHLSLDELDSPYPYVLILPQSGTERILAAHLGHLGVTVERPVELTGLRQDPDDVTALSTPTGTSATAPGRPIATPRSST